MNNSQLYAISRSTLSTTIFVVLTLILVGGVLTSLSPSALDRLGADELVNRANTVLERANARKTELAVLHVTQANLEELTQALQNFADAKQQPRTETADRMAQTQSLSNLIRARRMIFCAIESIDW